MNLGIVLVNEKGRPLLENEKGRPVPDLPQGQLGPGPGPEVQGGPKSWEQKKKKERKKERKKTKKGTKKEDMQLDQ